MFRLGVLTAPEWPDLTRDDRLMGPYLQAAGIQMLPVVWTLPLPEGLDGLLMRSTWGYYLQPQAFEHWLMSLQALPIPVLNPVDVMLDNLDKRYLLRLQAKGHPVVPTRLLEAGAAAQFQELVSAAGWQDVIVKPVVSASGHETHRLKATADLPASLGRMNAQTALLVQPFCPAIQQEGEWSLIFLGGQFSHCVLKRPGPEHYLVHEDHGGMTLAAAPPPELLQLAQNVVSSECSDSLYVRVDCVRGESGFVLMELELLEPCLYLEHEINAPARLAQAVIKGFRV